MSFVFLLLIAPILASAANFSGLLVKVIDGDTVEVLHKGRAEKIRLAEIDCPEKNQPYGDAAKRYVLDIAVQKIVTVEIETTDRYGRTVGEVFLPDGGSLNRDIVKAGYAWWYRKYSTDKSIGELEGEARKARRGLWQDGSPTAPWEWRTQRRSGGGADTTVGVVRTATHTKGVHDDPLYHGNSRSRVFHQSSCKDYNCKNCTVNLSAREEALASGYRPCGMCKP